MQSQPEPQYYTAIIQHQDPERLARLLELGDPGFFGGNSSSSKKALPVTSTSESVKVKSAAVMLQLQASDRLKKLLDLGNPIFFGGGR